MLHSVDKNDFASAIKQSYKLMTDAGASNLATQLIQTLDSALEPAVSAWITGQDIPDIAAGQYSVTKILRIRRSSDYLDAFRLLSEYMQDHEEGEKAIWSAKR